jgi:uncharacterized protein YdaU (DUF1376 family)
MGDLWFKFWAKDFLTDHDVDALEDGAAVVLVRVWCLCCIDGSAPSEPGDLARRIMRRYDRDFQRQFEAVKPFFELREGRLYSKRMEREKWMSERGRKGARAANANGRGVVKAPQQAPQQAAQQAAQGSGATSGAQKLEVRSQKELEVKGIPLTLTAVKGLAVIEPVEIVQNPLAFERNVPTGTLTQNQMQPLANEGSRVSILQAAEHAQNRLLALRKTAKKQIGFVMASGVELEVEVADGTAKR